MSGQISINRIPFFIEIGANTFDNLLPLARQGWRGIIVEPVKYYFDKLPEVAGVIYENVAIDSVKGTRTLYRLPPGVAEEVKTRTGWNAHGWASFSATHRDVVKYGVQDKLVAEQIDCITVDQLLLKHAVTSVELLVIDTEGNDYEILKTIPFKRLRPDSIRYETILIPEIEQFKAMELLLNVGYTLHRRAHDIVAETKTVPMQILL